MVLVVVGNLFRLSDGDQHAAGATTLVYCNVIWQVLELEFVHRQSSKYMLFITQGFKEL